MKNAPFVPRVSASDKAPAAPIGKTRGRVDVDPVDEPSSTIRDGHELKALELTEWGLGAAERAAAAVIGYNGETHDNGERFALRFYVNEGTDPNGKRVFDAWTPYRKLTYRGDTAAQAIANMLHGVSELGYSGGMNPGHPSDPALQPIQHAIVLLTEHLRWQTSRRLETFPAADNTPAAEYGLRVKESSSFDRDNQIIAALGTAIAALARVNYP